MADTSPKQDGTGANIKNSTDAQTSADNSPDRATVPEQQSNSAEKTPREIGGPKGPEPTRYGDWERNGRCSDF
jgi:hypothetical protein